TQYYPLSPRARRRAQSQPGRPAPKAGAPCGLASWVPRGAMLAFGGEGSL
ncbi:unnamed protein product, partial [Effrenium voratum]